MTALPARTNLVLRPRRARRGVKSPKLPQSGHGRVLKVVWSSGAEVQKKSLAPVQALFAPVQTSFAPVQETFSALPHRSSKPPLALSPDHFGAIWAIWLLSVPGVANLVATHNTPSPGRTDNTFKFLHGAFPRHSNARLFRMTRSRTRHGLIVPPLYTQ